MIEVNLGRVCIKHEIYATFTYYYDNSQILPLTSVAFIMVSKRKLVQFHKQLKIDE